MSGVYPTYGYGVVRGERVMTELITGGSLDEPMPWLATIAALPGSVTEDDIPADKMQRLKSMQHPDHDTAEWRGEATRQSHL